MQKNIYYKLIGIGVIILLLLIPSSFIMNLIRERQERGEKAQKEIFEKWGEKQRITGPILKIPYSETELKEHFREGKKIQEARHFTKYLYVLPKELKINSELATEEKHRGIYEVAVYQSKSKIKAVFPKISELNPDIPISTINWSKAELLIGLSDIRGLKTTPICKINQKQWELQNKGIYPGLNNTLGTSIDLKEDGSVSTDIELHYKGSQGLYFSPLGKTTTVDLSANWGAPSFQGHFLPDTHTVDQKHFKAHWEVLDLNRNIPSYWTEYPGNMEEYSFGTELFISSDNYLKTERSVKYAMLLILLSFICFFMIEVLQKVWMHPLQYLLIGVSLISFYTLLLSLSEQIGFNAAYLIAALSTTALIVWYLSWTFKKSILSWFNAIFLGTLYVFVFILVQMEDYALLVGSISIFIIIGLIMFFSRKIDWNNLKKRQIEPLDQ